MDTVSMFTRNSGTSIRSTAASAAQHPATNRLVAPSRAHVEAHADGAAAATTTTGAAAATLSFSSAAVLPPRRNVSSLSLASSSTGMGSPATSSGGGGGGGGAGAARTLRAPRAAAPGATPTTPRTTRITVARSASQSLHESMTTPRSASKSNMPHFTSAFPAARVGTPSAAAHGQLQAFGAASGSTTPQQLIPVLGMTAAPPTPPPLGSLDTFADRIAAFSRQAFAASGEHAAQSSNHDPHPRVATAVSPLGANDATARAASRQQFLDLLKARQSQDAAFAAQPAAIPAAAASRPLSSDGSFVTAEVLWPSDTAIFSGSGEQQSGAGKPLTIQEVVEEGDWEEFHTQRHIDESLYGSTAPAGSTPRFAAAAASSATAAAAVGNAGTVPPTFLPPNAFQAPPRPSLVLRGSASTGSSRAAAAQSHPPAPLAGIGISALDTLLLAPRRDEHRDPQRSPLAVEDRRAADDVGEEELLPHPTKGVAATAPQTVFFADDDDLDALLNQKRNVPATPTLSVDSSPFHDDHHHSSSSNGSAARLNIKIVPSDASHGALVSINDPNHDEAFCSGGTAAFYCEKCALMLGGLAHSALQALVYCPACGHKRGARL